MRAVFVAGPEAAVAQRHQTFAIQAVVVEFNRVGCGVVGLRGVNHNRRAIGVVGRFTGAAQRGGIGQTDDQGAVRALEFDGCQLLDTAAGGDTEVADARSVIGDRE